MPTLLLSPSIYTYDTIVLRRIALSQGWFVKRTSDDSGLKNIEHPIAVYGDQGYAYKIAHLLSIELVEVPLNWLCSLSHFYTKRCTHFCNLGSLDTFSTPLFVKPAQGREFPSKVYDSIEELFTFSNDNHLQVISSEPVLWELEFRCIIVDREVLTYSQYMKHRQLAELEPGGEPDSITDGLFAFLSTLLNDEDVEMPSTLVLDVGRIWERGWAVIEANPVWGSGLYKCDAEKAFTAIQKSCRSTKSQSLST